MKYNLLAAIFLFSSSVADAQTVQTIPVKAPRPELGIFGQSEAIANESQHMSFVGLQYRRWCNEHLGFRVIGAFANYSAQGSEIQLISGDTAVTKQERYNIGLPVIGLGIEAQRHFYKRVYLFAATELKGGYGKGDVDTMLTRAIGRTNVGSNSSERVGQHDASLFFVGISASIGAKIQWSRVSLGLEIFPVQMNYTKVDNGTRSSGITDMSLGNISQRLFLNWRL